MRKLIALMAAISLVICIGCKPESSQKGQLAPTTPPYKAGGPAASESKTPAVKAPAENKGAGEKASAKEPTPPPATK